MVPSPEDAPAGASPAEGAPDIPFRHRFDVRPVLGTPPFSSGPVAETGGWIRTADHDVLDDVLLAAITDSWPPAVFSRLEEPVGVPTIELTVHFRGEPARDSAWCLVRFRTREVGAGYLEETGEVWSTDGRLLADSRQLGVLLVAARRLAPARGHGAREHRPLLADASSSDAACSPVASGGSSTTPGRARSATS